MIIAEFDSERAALDWRAGNGGWIFASDCGRVLWFALQFTAGAVMRHHATRGLSGRLI